MWHEDETLFAVDSTDWTVWQSLCTIELSTERGRRHGGKKGLWHFMFMPHVNLPKIFSCCFSVFVPSSLSWMSYLSFLSSPSSLSSPAFPGLVISSCPGCTSSPPPEGGRVLRCWRGAGGCISCGAARLRLHICLCTSPRETRLTPHSPEGYLHRQGGGGGDITVSSTFWF